MAFYTAPFMKLQDILMDSVSHDRHKRTEITEKTAAAVAAAGPVVTRTIVIGASDGDQVVNR